MSRIMKSAREQLALDFGKFYANIEVPEQLFNSLYWCAIGVDESNATWIYEQYTLGEMSALDTCRNFQMIITGHFGKR